MRNKLVIASVVLLLIFPALSFSSTMDKEKHGLDHSSLSYKGNQKAQNNEAVNIYSINFRNIEANSLLLPEDYQSRQIDNYGDQFNALTSTYHAGQNLPRSFVSNVSIKPYFGDPDKSFKSSVFDLPSNISEVIAMGTAFLTNLAAHEFGHAIVGEHVGATGNTVSFFEKQGGQFFLGMSSVKI